MTSGTSDPPRGLPNRTAIETVANMLPLLTPILRTSEMCATRLGGRETREPDAKPKRAANITSGIVPREGSHMAKTTMTLKKDMMITTLKSPMRSAA